MAQIYTWETDVRAYELDASGHVNHAVYQNYLEEAATRASTDAGFPYDWYFQQHRAWVVRKMTIHFINPLQYGDRVRLHTWVSDVHRVYSHREYDMRRAVDDLPVVRARAKWVYVDLDTKFPAYIPAEAHEYFEPTGELEEIPCRLVDARPLNGNYGYTSRRRVQWYEMDPAGIVNNAVYLRWIDQAKREAFEQAGWPEQRLREENLKVMQVAHEIDYMRPAVSGDKLRITSTLLESKASRFAWEHRILHESSEDLIARDYSICEFASLDGGSLATIPTGVLEPLLHGANTSSSG